MFEPLNPATFSEREEEVLKFWKSKSIFLKSIDQRKGGKTFTFYDGPPFATGLPHYGHLLAGTIKDVVPRYKTMKGFKVPRRFGWDCHGLPVEQEIEKAFSLSGAKAIEAFGMARFNEECRKIVLRYTSEWQGVVERMGRWVDFSKTYKTMDLPFMESVWWAFKKLYEMGLVYEGFKVMPFSAKLGTPLSNFEASENYKEVDDPSLTVAFTLEEDPETAILAWTTTPWTLVSNLAVIAGAEIEYVKVKDPASGKKYWLAASRLSAHFKESDKLDIVERKKGKELAGLSYLPLFNYFSGEKTRGAFRVILDEGVSLEDGTGFIHAAPAFGELDFYACQREGVPLVCPVDNNGQFTDEVPEYQGRFVKEADKDIAKRLKAQGSLFHQATLRHRYPFCWRSDTPLIYKTVTTWFVAVEKIKDAMLAANAQIHWTPAHIKEGRFGKWLEGARDWAISRNRYWGTPIPLWRAADGEILCLGSIQELEEASGAKVDDLHRHFIDSMEINRNGKIFKRVPEVFDCWFESGSMPYAQNHYPFENKEEFESHFPADFIAEGLDQTRGWFYTLTVLAAALFDKPAFKNVIVNGIILASDGAKMSKRLRNYPDPLEMVHKYGADAVRLYMMHSPAVKGEDLCFQESGLELVLRQVLIPWWNAYSFFITYATIYRFKPQKESLAPQALIDRWIISLTHRLIHQVEEGMNAYDLSLAVEPFVEFIDQLTNWYIRRSRRRFWEDQDTPDRREAFETLYYVLKNLSKVAAPFVPFISESIYRNLRMEEEAESVHLADFPSYDPQVRDLFLEEGMNTLQLVVALGHGLRKTQKTKVRQPLPSAEIACRSAAHLSFLKDQKHLIAEELNVKEVRFFEDETLFVSYQAKPNFRGLGKKVGKKIPAAQKKIAELPLASIMKLFEGESLVIDLEGESFTLVSEDVEVTRTVKPGLVADNKGEITIALDLTLSEPLILEGLAREIVNKVNTMRRESGFSVTDRIQLKLHSTPLVQKALSEHQEWIAGEVLAKTIEWQENEGQEWDLNGELARLQVVRTS